MTILASVNLDFYMYGWEEASSESAVKPGEAAAALYTLLQFQWQRIHMLTYLPICT